jgi:F0F1-type ATP synthase membrane subunit b/b'
MPQLDTLTYLSQLFWVFIIFAVFYAMVVRHILPALSTAIKVRKKKLQANSTLISSLETEELETASSYETILMNSLAESRSLLTKTTDSATEWLKVTSSQTNASELRESNEEYVKALGALTGKKFLVKNLYS